MHLYLHYHIDHDSLERQNQHRFTTKDRDQDERSGVNCAVDRQGAWWYSGCADSNLNGNYSLRGNSNKGLKWFGYTAFPWTMKTTKMMVKCDQS